MTLARELGRLAITALALIAICVAAFMTFGCSIAQAGSDAPTPLDRYFDAPLDFRPENTPGVYQFLRQETPRKIYLHITPEQGWNASTTSNDGRTGLSGLYVWVDHEGQGDGGGITIVCQVSGAPRGTALANPACVLYNGQVDAGADGVLMNPVEVHLDDHGFRNVSGVGYVSSITRSGPRDPESDAFLQGVRSQSAGEIDSHFAGSGQARAGVDLTMLSSPERAGVVMKQGDRIYYEGTPTVARVGSVQQMAAPGETWQGVYTDAEGYYGLITVVEGVPVFQLQRDWVILNGNVAIMGQVYLHGQTTPHGPAQAVCYADGRLYASDTGECRR